MTGPVRLGGLGNHFVELLGRGLSRDEFAAEVARLLSETLRMRAVAVLGYERRYHRLVLLAHHGLSADACAALGAGGDASWDIPLRGLHNRRISVIAAAQQNPFVPRALVKLSTASGLSIASLPIYHEYDPAGALLLFAGGNHAFPDAMLQTLSQALRVCARGLVESDAAAGRSHGAGREEESVDEVVARLIEESGLSQPSKGSAAPRHDDRDGAQALHLVEAQSARPAAQQQLLDDLVAQVQRLEQRLTQAQEELGRNAQVLRTLTISRQALSRERDGLLQQIADLEHARETESAELRTQVSSLEERLLAVESERVRHQRLGESRQAAAQQSVAALESERTTLLERLKAADATAAKAHAALSTERAERERLAAMVEPLTAEVRTQHEELARIQAQHADERATLEADRDGWREQASTAGAQLAQRGEALVAQERDLRATIAARDAATTQLQAARAEIDRLTALAEELERRATQLEAARAHSLAEGAALQQALEGERAARMEAEGRLKADLVTAQAEIARSSAEAAALRAELGQGGRALSARDEQIALLRQEQEGSRQAETRWQEERMALHAELTMLTARIDQAAAERQQFVAQQAGLRTALEQAQQSAHQLNIEHAAALGQLQAEADELRRQVNGLTAERDEFAARLERALQDGTVLNRRLAEALQHGEELNELLRERDRLVQNADAERRQLAEQSAKLTGQWQAAREALERAQARSAQERATLEADRDGWREQATAARAQLAQRTEALADAERELRGAVVARDSGAAEVEALRHEIARQSALNEELQRTLGELEAVRVAALADAASVRQTLNNERAGRADSERALRHELSSLRVDAERVAADAKALRDELADRTQAMAERDAHLAALRAEITALREQSTDRTVLADQASQLGNRIVELEQALAAARGETMRTEQERAALAEKLASARRREEEGAATAAHAREELERVLQMHTAERDRLAAAQAAQERQVGVLQGALAEMQTALQQAVAEREAQVGQLQEERERWGQVQAQWEEREAGWRAEVAELQARVEAGASESEQVRAARAAVEEQLALVVAEQGAAEQALAQALQAAREQVAQLEQERAAQQAAGRAARAQLRQAEAAHAAALGQGQAEVEELRGQVRALTAGQEAARAEVERAAQALAAQGPQVEAERRRAAGLAEQCAQLERALATAETQRTGLEAELGQAQAQAEALRQQSEDRGVWAQQAGELGQRVVELEQEQAALRGEAARAGRQRAALAEELEAVRRQHAQARAAAEQEQQELRATVQRLSEERTRLEAAQQAGHGELEAQRATVAQLQSTVTELQAERGRWEQEGRDVAQRLAEAHRHLEELGPQLRQREAAAEAAAAERQRLAEAVRIAEATAEELTAERDDMRRKMDAAIDRLEKERASRIQEVMALQKELTRFETDQHATRARDAQARRSEERMEVDYDAPLVIERSAPLDTALEPEAVPAEAPAPDSAAAPTVPRESAGEIVLLDTSPRADEACAALQGFEVTRAAPNEGTVDELARHKVACVMLNLAAGPAAWRILRALRERTATRNTPVLAYLMQPGALKGFCFGRADFGVWPMEADRMAERLGRLRPKLKRVLAVSADIDGINRLREPLSRANISTSIVLDGKQALDFALMVQPDAAVIHLSPDCPSAARAIASLRADESMRTLPLLVMFDKSPAREDMFYAAVARELTLKPTFQLASLPSDIARLIA